MAAMILKLPPHCGHGQFGNTLKMLALIAMSSNARLTPVGNMSQSASVLEIIRPLFVA